MFERETRNDHTFAFITPSYAPDFQRCKLLCWSIKQFVSHPVKHYIIVDHRDLKLFQQLSNETTTIITKENVLPSWIKQLPLSGKKNIWLNLKGYKTGHLLLRGWLIQQMIKLAAAHYIQEDVLVFIDSDVAFINTFDVNTLVDQDQVRLFRVPHLDDHDDEMSRKWKKTAKKLLNISSKEPCYDFYIGQIVTWRRDTLVKLYRHIEANFHKDWMEVLSSISNLSEYILYGIFANYVLGDASGHYDDHLQKNCWCYWENKPMSERELAAFFQEAYDTGHRAVMISAKSGIDLSVQEFQDFLALTTREAYA